MLLNACFSAYINHLRMRGDDMCAISKHLEYLSDLINYVYIIV